MSGIVLSNAVRQNLSSLQATAELLATTQSRLSSGKKVNSALDNPTNFFTASGLDSRASDINNLLDGIGNGVQILNAASTGITSLNKLVDSAKSIANQALQTTAGYATKSNVSTTISGATADDLRGTVTYSNAIATSNTIYGGKAAGNTAIALDDTLGGTLGTLDGTAVTRKAAAADTRAGAVMQSGGVNLADGTGLLSDLQDSTGAAVNLAAGDSFKVDGKTITFADSGSATADANGNYTIGLNQSLDTVLHTIDAINGNDTASLSAVDGATGKIVLDTGLNRSLVLADGKAGTLAKLGLTAVTTNLDEAGGAATAISDTTKLFNTKGALDTAAIVDGTTLSVNGKTITFRASDAPPASAVDSGSGVSGNTVTDGAGNSTIYLGTDSTYTSATVGDVLTAIDLASGVRSASITSGVALINSQNAGQTKSTVAGTGAVKLQSSTGADLSVTGSADLLKRFGLTSSEGSGSTTVTANRTTEDGTISNLIEDGSTLNVNGKTITFKNAPVPAASVDHTGISGNLETDGNGNSTVYLQAGTMADVLKAIDLATGVQTATLNKAGATLKTTANTANSSLSGGAMKLSTGLSSDLTITGTGNALAAFGLNGPTGTGNTFTATRAPAPGGVNGKSLTFSSFNGGSAVNITFGDGTNGTVKTLAQLNVQLAANNMTASIDNSTGKLTVATSNDYASHTLGGSDGGVIGGTLTGTQTFSIAAAPIADVNAQTTRAGLVKQFNDILDQITTTAQDSSFNGVNLLNGDNLKLVFNETGKSTITIQGVTNNPTGLGLSSLTSGTDFIDNTATNKVLAKLSTASTTLRSQASAFGSNLSVVQARQEFSKNLINVLQTGASNLTLADTNEEAANSQALSTRQSIAVSALGLANTSQQSVLQLLR